MYSLPKRSGTENRPPENRYIQDLDARRTITTKTNDPDPIIKIRLYLVAEFSVTSTNNNKSHLCLVAKATGLSFFSSCVSCLADLVSLPGERFEVERQ